MGENLKSKGGGDASPQLLNLIPNERDWRDGRVKRWSKGVFRGLKAGEEKDLELRLGLPGGKDDKSSSSSSSSSVLPLGFFTKSSKTITNNSCSGSKRGFIDTAEDSNEDLKKREQSGFFQLQNRAALRKELSQQTSWIASKTEQQERLQKSLEKKAAHAVGVKNNSGTRAAGTRVVGWPPVGSFRKTVASSSRPSVEPSKNDTENQNKIDETRKGLLVNAENQTKTEETRKGLLVKINMDGIPIGRKIDLKSYSSYDNLSLAVEDLFQGLLAAQMNPTVAEAQKNIEKKQVFAGLLDGTGQYTLVYEDNDGDIMLAGDVPWDMFVSTAKRLRVLRSSDLSAIRLGAISRTKKATDC